MIKNKSRKYSNYVPPPPVRPSWEREPPWEALLGAFDDSCSILIVPLIIKKRVSPPLVIIKKNRKLSVAFNPFIHTTPFHEYDHLILWKKTLLIKIPAIVSSQYPQFLTEFYENQSIPDVPWDNDWSKRLKKFIRKKSLKNIKEIPIKLFRSKEITISSKLGGDARKYLSWLGLIAEERGKKEDQNIVNCTLDIITSVLKTKEEIKPHYLPMKDIQLALDTNPEVHKYIKENKEAYDRRSLNRILNNLKEAIKHYSLTDDKGCFEFIKKNPPSLIRYVYWNFQSFCHCRKTPPPLRIK